MRPVINPETLLSSFSGINLKELDAVKLMNRVDTKFMVNAAMLPVILYKLKTNYRVLEINGKRSPAYESVYYDTGDYLFYYQHMTGKLGRMKVRCRSYLSSGETFIEVKKTTNKNRTVKHRIPFADGHNGELNVKESKFLSEHVLENIRFLKPTLVTRFDRITLTDNDINERITIDTNLSFAPCKTESYVSLPYLSIIELKRERAGYKSPLGLLLKSYGIHPLGFSKYCYGVSAIHSPGKMNLMKTKNIKLRKIEYDYYKAVGA